MNIHDIQARVRQLLEEEVALSEFQESQRTQIEESKQESTQVEREQANQVLPKDPHYEPVPEGVDAQQQLPQLTQAEYFPTKDIGLPGEFDYSTSQEPSLPSENMQPQQLETPQSPEESNQGEHEPEFDETDILQEIIRRREEDNARHLSEIMQEFEAQKYDTNQSQLSALILKSQT